MKVLVATLSAILLLIVVLWRPWEQDTSVNLPPKPVDRRLPPADDPPVTPVEIPSAAAPPAAEPPPDPVLLSTEETRKIRDAIENLELTLRDYGTALDGNPVGTNAEITAALLGDNAKQLKLELPAGSSLNASGELCDPWETPWFFHQLGKTKTELRSAGPDKRMYTNDDFVR